ncbi:MAG TPA: VOC family protein [Vicinamibacterales bacterium]|nr:VOC family protein [Vicinamibacterales bacterium]
MPTLTAIAPQFVVDDVRVAAEYYRDVLGFRILGYFLDPPVFAMVARDRAEIHFGKADPGAGPSPNGGRRKISSDAYIWTTDLDGLHAELVANGANVVEKPSMRVYRCYEMAVEDPFGYRLVFSMDFEHATG